MEPGPETVDGDFGDTEFTARNRTTRFYTENGDYFIETEDVPDGSKTLKIIGVAGIAPLQQYLVETEPGRIQSFDVVWDQEQKRWKLELQTFIPAVACKSVRRASNS